MQILTNVTYATANAIVEDDVNSTSYEGFRASIKAELNDNWDALDFIYQARY